ncbi:MAG: hypothetical protein WAU01_09055 [Saprospiraceae bacterium]
MKTNLLLLTFILISIGISAQSIIGAWQSDITSETGENVKRVVIFSDGYQVSTWYDAGTGKFIKTNGGTWKLDGDTMTEKVEFDTYIPERVGTEVTFTVYIKDNEMGIIGHPEKFVRIDNGTPGQLNGAWLMSGRVSEGKIQSRDTNIPRKTMKILSGTRFQWIAYNTETKQFSGTGGGTYTTVNGEYIENIEFFSRDDTRVGASLKFSFDLLDGTWHHKGLSSKGEPIHEIWSVRE